jgi:hypothetical protein
MISFSNEDACDYQTYTTFSNEDARYATESIDT